MLDRGLTPSRITTSSPLSMVTASEHTTASTQRARRGNGYHALESVAVLSIRHCGGIGAHGERQDTPSFELVVAALRTASIGDGTRREEGATMHRCLAIVLAGGEGRRLSPLTRERSKPAVFFGGRYRLIDFVLSNLVNSGLQQIKVITQCKSTSLVRHLGRAWPLASAGVGCFVEPVPAAMNLGPHWFRGTADALFQNLDLLRESRPDDVLVFGADHVYKMDVRAMLDHHRLCGADLTVAVLPVPRSEASAFGCLAVDDRGRVTDFVEKPADPPPMPGRPDMSLVSMGNYIFRSPTIIEELRRDARSAEGSHDLGKDILASAHRRMEVVAYDFSNKLVPGEHERGRGYWRDVGTLDAYYEASMDLVSVHPHLDLYNEAWPIRGLQPLCGPAKFVFRDEHGHRTGQATDSLIGAGAIVSGAAVEHSILFHQAHLHSYASVRDSILFPQVHVGRGARLRRCIVDRGVQIPPGLVVGEDPEEDRRRFTVSERGIVIVGRAELGQVDDFDVGSAPRTADSERPSAVVVRSDDVAASVLSRLEDRVS